MKEGKPTKKRSSPDGMVSDLQRQCEEMEAQLDEAEETLRAIRGGEVDAFAVSTPTGNRIYTLEGSDRAYRLLIEDIAEGALTLTGDGLILFCNKRFGEIVGKPVEKVIGSSFFIFISPTDEQTVRTLLETAPVSRARVEIRLTSASGRLVPVLLSATPLPEINPRGVCLVVTDLTERKKPASLNQITAGIFPEIRNLLSDVNSVLDAFQQESKALRSKRKETAKKRKETAKEFYLKLKSTSDRIEDIIRRIFTTNADARPSNRVGNQHRGAVSVKGKQK